MKNLLLSSIILIVIIGCTHNIDKFKCECDCGITKFKCSDNEQTLEIEGAP